MVSRFVTSGGLVWGVVVAIVVKEYRYGHLAIVSGWFLYLLVNRRKALVHCRVLVYMVPDLIFSAVFEFFVDGCSDHYILR